MAPDWLENILAATDRLFLDTLGPDISEDARDLCPVFGGENSTATPVSLAIGERMGRDIPGGALRDSIEFHLNKHDLIVAATGSDERTYAYFVECGHRIVVFGRDTGRYKEAQPFIRPAVFRVRRP
jgi:hypothetical protein